MTKKSSFVQEHSRSVEWIFANDQIDGDEKTLTW